MAYPKADKKSDESLFVNVILFFPASHSLFPCNILVIICCREKRIYIIPSILFGARRALSSCSLSLTKAVYINLSPSLIHKLQER